MTDVTRTAVAPVGVATGDLRARDVLETLHRLRRLLSRRAPFTALTRAELGDLGSEIVALFDGADVYESAMTARPSAVR